MFETAYEEKKLLPEGEYECIIKSAFINATNSKSPTEYFSVNFVIRNDVVQKYQNKHIFHAIWRKKPEKRTKDDNRVDGFSYKQLMNLCKGAGVPKNTSFKDLDDLGKYLKGRCCLVTVGHDEWNGNTQVRVKWTNPTRYPDCKHKFPVSANTRTAQTTEPEENNYEPISSDEDLPF